MHAVAALPSTFVGEARSTTGIDGPAAIRYQRAMARLPWSQHHHQCIGLRDGSGRVLASADRFELEAVLHGRAMRCCGLGNITETTTHGDRRYATELLAHVVDDAKAHGFAAVLVSSAEPYAPLQDSFTPLLVGESTLHVIESDRRGAPMVPVRSGERGDFVHLATAPPLGSSCLRLARNADLLEFTICRHRLLAAVSAAGRREVRFLVVEEGSRAAAYVVVTVTREGWRLEECGDHDPTGARVGALLQVMIAREPAEDRPRITATLPPGFQPPQVSVTDTGVMAARLWLKVFRPDLSEAVTADAPIAWWPGDPPGGGS